MPSNPEADAGTPSVRVYRHGAKYKTQSTDDKAYFSPTDMMEVVDQMIESSLAAGKARIEAEKDPNAFVTDGSSLSIFMSVRYPITRYVLYGSSNMKELLAKLEDFKSLARQTVLDIARATCYKLHQMDGESDLSNFPDAPVSADWDCTKWDMNRIRRVPTGPKAGENDPDVAYLIGLLTGAPGRISDTWGMREHPNTHEWTHHAGLDIAIPKGTPLYAPVPGVVQCRDHIYAGRYMYITYGGSQFRYLHMSKRIKCGQRVNAGDLVGYSGDTGRGTGAHLHFDIDGAPNDGVKDKDPILTAQKILTDYYEANCGPNANKPDPGTALGPGSSPLEPKPLTGKGIGKGRSEFYLPKDESCKSGTCRNTPVRAAEAPEIASPSQGTPGAPEGAKPQMRSPNLPPNVVWDPEYPGRTPDGSAPSSVPPTLKGAPPGPGKIFYNGGDKNSKDDFVYRSPDGRVWRLPKGSNVWEGMDTPQGGMPRRIQYDMEHPELGVENWRDPETGEKQEILPNVVISGDQMIYDGGQGGLDCDSLDDYGIELMRRNLKVQGVALATEEEAVRYIQTVMEVMNQLNEILPGMDGGDTLYDIMRRVGMVLFIMIAFLTVVLHLFYRLTGDSAKAAEFGPVAFVWRFVWVLFVYIAFPDIVMAVMQISDLVRDIIAGDGGNGYLESLETLNTMLDATLFMNASTATSTNGFFALVQSVLDTNYMLAVFKGFLLRILFYLILSAIYIINISCDFLLALMCLTAPLVFPFCMLPRFGESYYQGLIRGLLGFAVLGPICAIFLRMMMAVTMVGAQVGVVAFITIGCACVGISSKLVAVAATMSSSHLGKTNEALASVPSRSAAAAGSDAARKVGGGAGRMAKGIFLRK